MVKQVGCAEYLTCYVHGDGTVWATLWRDNTQKYTQYPGLKVVGITGGQYQCLAWNAAGTAYELTKTNTGGPGIRVLPMTPGGVVYGYMFNQSFYTVNPAGDLYYLADPGEDVMGLGSGTMPKLILQGRQVDKLASSEDFEGLLIHCKNNDVLKWDRGAAAPYKISTGIDIAVGRSFFVVNTGTQLLAWGSQVGYIGGTSTGVPAVLKWPGKWPLKKMVANWNTLHTIDADGNMYGAGENVMGEVGNGQGMANWKNAKNPSGGPSPYAWNWLKGQMIQAPVQIAGKWKDLFTSGNITFFLYAIGANDKLYSWGRNKNRALGNNRNADDGIMSNFPNWEDVWAPIEVDPSKPWVLVPWNKDTAPNAYVLPNPLPVPADPAPPIPVKKIKKIITIFDDWTQETKDF